MSERWIKYEWTDAHGHPRINLFMHPRFRRNTNCRSERVSAAARATRQPCRLHYVMASHISHRICCETLFSRLAHPSVTRRRGTRGLKLSTTSVKLLTGASSSGFVSMCAHPPPTTTFMLRGGDQSQVWGGFYTFWRRDG